MRPLLVVLISAGCVLAAVPGFAQVPAPVIPNRPFVANDANRSWLPAITVQGRSTARVPADIIRFGARFSVRVSAAQDALAIADRVVDALVRAGAEPSSVQRSVAVQQGGNPQGMPFVVFGAMRQPSRERAMTAIVRLSEALRGEQNLVVQQVGAAFGLTDCSAVDDRLRREALADAKRRAESLARASNVSVGNVIAMSEQNTDQVVCGFAPDSVYVGGIIDGVDLAPTPTVQVFDTVSVSYSIP